jgi:ABC-type Fe3+ transport system permease subunit/DNA-binding beta-propeller fold protein YncE
MNWALVWNSLLVAGSATIIAIVFGFSAALCAAALTKTSRQIITLSAIVALALPPFLVTNCWIELLGQTGVWRDAVHFDIYGVSGTIWILSLMLWPVPYLFLSSAWNRIEPSHVEADPMLNGFALVRWLLLPAARGALAQAAVISFVLALNNFAVPAILQVKVFSAETWVSFNTNFDYAAALRLGWPMILCPLLLLIAFRRNRVSFTWKSQGATGTLFRRSLGPKLFLVAIAIACIAIFFSIVIPLAQLTTSARTWREFLPAVEAGHFAITYSLLFAACTATAILIFSLLTWRARLHEILWIPFFVPGVLLGIAIIWLFNRPSLAAIYQSMLIVIAAYAIRYAGFGWNTVSSAIHNADRNLIDAAQLDGANRWQTLRFALWPQISSQAAAAWYVTYLLCLWDVETLVLIVPPGEENLSLRIFNLLHYGHNAQVNALCLILLGLAVLPLVLWLLLTHFSNRASFPCPPLEERARERRFTNRFSLVAALLLITSCSIQQSNHVAIESKLFDAVQVIGTRGTALGQLNKPRAVAVDANDNLYVVDMTARIQKFSPDGKFLLSWQLTHTEKGKPKGMDRDKNGNIILVEPHYQRVNHFTTEGKLVSQWGVKGTNVGELAFPRSVAVNSHGNLYITEYSLVERVQIFSPDGSKFIGVFGKDGNAPGEFNRAEGVGIDSQDRVYVADSCNHRIQIFDADGKFIRTYGHAGSGIGELSYPYDIRVDKQGNQFVCEFGNSRIQVFDKNDKPIETIGKPGGAPGEFANPWSIALDSKGNLYVADSQNHRVEKLVRKHVTTKLQTPSPQAPEKLQTSSSTRAIFGTWCLVLLWSLDLGSWSFHP